ncbi:cytochrome P450 [Xylariaceae sp. FL1019]|nr:cytochrome P450 [Xylariaceae sp. FL1019]
MIVLDLSTDNTMTFLAILFTAVAVCLATVLVLRLTHACLSPLRDIPGPFITRWSDAWYAWRVHKGNFERENIQLHRTYGPIIRYGPNRYSISDSEAVNTIYGHGARFTKSSWYYAWQHPQKPNLFADRSIQRHGETRRQLQSTYTMTSLVSYEPYVNQCSDIFSQRLAEMAAAGTSVDMGHWLQCYAFDVIGEITFGRRFGFLDQGVDIEGLMSAIEASLAYASVLGIYPRIHPLGFKVFNFMAGSKGGGRAYVEVFARTMVAEHERNRQKSMTENGSTLAEPFVSKFLTRHEEAPERFSKANIVAGCTSNVAAGSDTTGVSLSAIIYYLLKYPRYLQALRMEIAKFQKQGALSESYDFKQTQEMPFLQAVIKEGLRMHPATGLPLERCVFNNGTIVGISSWVLHRDKTVFGEDVDDFNPERWLTDDKEKLAAMNRQWIPFGMGSRTCIGRHISTLEISKLIPRIVQDFDFELSDGITGSEKSWSTRNHWFVKPVGFRVRVSRRSS